MFLHHAFRSLTLLTILLLASGFSVAHEKTRLVVFGDSLSDPGNFFALTGQMSHAPYDLIPSAPYAIGGHHFSNGPTWVEQFARELKQRSGPAYRTAKFTNYAVGGARARAHGFMDLSTQVGSFLSRSTRHREDDSIYIVMIGANDVRDAIEALAVDPSGAQSAQIVTAAILGLRDNVLALISSGANQFVIGNAPDLALVPAIRLLGPQAQNAAHFFSVQFNMALDNLISGLQNTLPITVHRLDVYTLLHQVVAEPNAAGLTVVDSPCITPGVVAGAVCAQPDSYLFWDGIHPTRRGHRLIAERALSVVAPSACANKQAAAATP